LILGADRYVSEPFDIEECSRDCAPPPAAPGQPRAQPWSPSAMCSSACRSPRGHLAGVLELGLTFRSGERAGERALWLLGGIVSVALAVVLFIRPDIGAESLAIVFGLYSVAFGISALVLSTQATELRSKAAHWLPAPS
jgi:hypothetical protein